MSFLQSGFTLCNKSPLPAGVTKAAAIAALQDRDHFLRADPHLTSFERIDDKEPKPAAPAVLANYEAYEVPAPVTAQRRSDQVQVYEVHDHLPNPVWSSDITSVEEFVDCDQGVWVRVRSPMGVVLETTWFICEVETETSKLELVQTLEGRCNRLLAGICKAQIDKGWRTVHENLIKGMVVDGNANGTATATAAAAATS